MQQLQFQGNHYTIGQKWGRMLKQNKIHLMESVPFQETEERRQFVETCLPFYQRFCPDILAEIQGIADGQEISVKRLQSVLFGMYCLMPEEPHCSSFLVRNKSGVFLGRNSDFLTITEERCMNIRYSFDDAGHYDFLGNTTAFVEMEDGINQYGLAIALTSVAPYKVQPGINVGMLLRLVLERCKSVDDAIVLITQIPHVGSGTLVIGDAQQQGILVELSPDKMAIRRLEKEQDCLIATNMFNLPEMKTFNRLPEDTWFAEERYHTMTHYLSENLETIDLKQSQELLSGKFGFMCEYDRSTGKDTVWSCVYDLQSSEIFRSAGNPSRNEFQQDKGFS
ncbi:choloylglycine hydrolase [Enterococcus florum]|uniref:Choloylglycine hydrolase n=1 Tax=Enterococcus florum TaxID=2480627 RepID=A0A4P5P8J8_9ENTE|nr:C45 family peptidase [Enterococcus florum]GCF92541.1 choloylglycine hydrolase [Enterococcus florum]